MHNWEFYNCIPNGFDMSVIPNHAFTSDITSQDNSFDIFPISFVCFVQM